MLGEAASRHRARRIGLRLGATAVAAIVVAEAAVFLLRPRPGGVESVEVSERSYFSADQIDRARDYRGGQRLLLGGTLAVEGGLLVLLAAGRPRLARRALERVGAHPVRGGALAAAGISFALAAGTAPFGIASHERAVDVGLSTQSLGGWAEDWLKSTGVTALIVAGGGAVAIALLRRFRRRWWIPATGVVIAFEVLFVYLAPVVLAPLFNRYQVLEEGPARRDALELAERAGVDVGQVYRVDASRRTTGLNAYVNGLGSTKRVVLYDNLIEDVPRGERRAVIAHELGHVRGDDVPRGLLWVALATPLGLLLAAELAESIGRRSGVDPASPAGLPALALALTIVAFGGTVIGNQLSRAVEERADTFALDLTDDPEGLIELQKRLTIRNVSDPDPPRWYELSLATHPPAVERIGAAVAWERGERP